mmetsp:Transcript_21531/g.61608  ORF Transcript_21531/g.61608 Transcript_21531/m.61608 type:complete len:200 (-) Transcript_21531:182-781(-)
MRHALVRLLGGQRTSGGFVGLHDHDEHIKHDHCPHDRIKVAVLATRKQQEHAAHLPQRVPTQSLIRELDPVFRRGVILQQRRVRCEAQAAHVFVLELAPHGGPVHGTHLARRGLVHVLPGAHLPGASAGGERLLHRHLVLVPSLRAKALLLHAKLGHSLHSDALPDRVGCHRRLVGVALGAAAQHPPAVTTVRAAMGTG